MSTTATPSRAQERTVGAAPVRIVIAGGGFGGVEVARELERILPSDVAVQITLVNRENYFLFTPMLHEVAASDLELTTIVNPLRQLVKRTSIFTGLVESIDVERRSVQVSHADGGHTHHLAYDHLVIALGAVTNFHGIEGLAERAQTMKSLGDAIALRNQLIANLEEADFECSSGSRSALLTVLVAGGGFAGVETVAAVHDLLHAARRYYRNVKATDIRVVVVHPGPHLLPELGEALGQYTQERLGARGLEVYLNTRVVGIDGDDVLLSSGDRIATRNLVWTAGTSVNPILNSIPCRKERGRVCVEPTLQVAGFPGVWALGDCAAIPDPDGGTYPPTAQHALREGTLLARNIAATLRGEALAPFRFRTIGLLASIGQRKGVAVILGWKFSGFLAWWMWRTIYLSKLPRLEKKVRVALTWTLDVFFAKDIVQYATDRAPAMKGDQSATTVSPAEPVRELM